ncbi:MAG: hydroxymethylbilane synthase, partial [Terriglobia bacterium]
MHFIIGSRGSTLALWQAEWVRSRLREAGDSAEIKVITTTGDRMASASLAQPPAKGLFIKEIEESLLAGDVDLAVHSLKDLPVDQPQGLYIAAIPEREDARDALLTRSGVSFDNLPPQSSVGTSSPRRQSQLRSLRPDLKIVPLRGNVDTRVRKLDRGDYDAIVMAAAGLHRLGLQDRIAQYFAPSEICPAAGQGALAIEIRQEDDRVAAAVQPLDHAATRS